MACTGTYHRAGCHIGDSDVTVIRKVATRLMPWRIEHKQARKNFFRQQLDIHHRSQLLFQAGRF